MGVTEAVAKGGRILGPKLSYCVFFISEAFTRPRHKGAEAWQGKLSQVAQLKHHFDRRSPTI